MQSLGQDIRLRAAAVWCGASGGVLGLVGLVGAELRAGLRLTPGPGAFAELLVDLCAWGALGAALWLWWVTTTVTLPLLVGRRPAARGIVRTAVLAACGIAVVTAIGPASATGAGPAPVPGGPAQLAGLPLPDRATGAADGAAPAAGRPDARQPRDRVVVRPGDSLWSIVRADLGAAATDATIAAEVRAAYAANRTTIGADPDLIVPGQVLDLPDDS